MSVKEWLASLLIGYLASEDWATRERSQFALTILNNACDVRQTLRLPQGDPEVNWRVRVVLDAYGDYSGPTPKITSLGENILFKDREVLIRDGFAEEWWWHLDNYPYGPPTDYESDDYRQRQATTLWAKMVLERDEYSRQTAMEILERAIEEERK